MTDRDDDPELDELARALRGATLDAPASTVAATRARIVGTARRRAGGPSWMLAAAAAMLVVLGGSTVWAFYTGRLSLGGEDPPAAPPRAIEPPRALEPAPSRRAVTAAPVIPANEPAPIAPANEPAPIAPPEPSVDLEASQADREPPRPIDPAERRAYDAAHALHFTERDWPGAIAAWDAYLASFPRGRFGLEARYNRALALVHAGRETEGREALTPFAEGRYGRYRRTEAQALLDALEQP